MKLRTLILALALAPLALADQAADIATIKANELAFNKAQNEGRFEEMFNYMFRTRTVFPTSGARMINGWSDADVQRRKDDMKNGRQSNLEVQDLQVQLYGDTAIATFYRVGTEKAAGAAKAVPARYRFTGVWIRTKDGWKLAHRHESPLTQ
ncbi:MAG: SnoaL-like domain [Acidobacteriota bacterium]|jgi:ketosteroid isomerase-like protein